MSRTAADIQVDPRVRRHISVFEGRFWIDLSSRSTSKWSSIKIYGSAATKQSLCPGISKVKRISCSTATAPSASWVKTVALMACASLGRAPEERLPRFRRNTVALQDENFGWYRNHGTAYRTDATRHGR